jgi:hypothetical protein
MSGSDRFVIHPPSPKSLNVAFETSAVVSLRTANHEHGKSVESPQSSSAAQSIPYAAIAFCQVEDSDIGSASDPVKFHLRGKVEVNSDNTVAFRS